MQVSTRAGVAVYYRPHPGASNEVPCFTDTLERIRELAPPGVVCVIDSGFGHLSKLCAADAAGLQFVVPLRADTGWAGWFAADVPDGLAALDRLDHCSTGNGGCPSTNAPCGKACCASKTSPTTTPAPPTGCASPTSGLPKRPPPSPMPANAPWPRPKTRSPESATASAGATTRPQAGRRPGRQDHRTPHRRPDHRHHRRRRPGQTHHRLAPQPHAITSASTLTGSTPWPPTCPTHPAAH